MIIIKYREQIRQFSSFHLYKARIHADNFFYGAGQGKKRHKPVALLQKETELQLYVGEPFRSFRKSDWREFWEIIYGAYPMEPPERPGLPRRVRQMDRGELAYELASRYPQPFAYFTPEHWKMFFSIILKQDES
ncbi:MAG: hypothetical protein ISS89_03785 [Candidatus Omnitrophica bacterium]|nr:hypothetical protein [Candidatus Omnitrophota bacterium]